MVLGICRENIYNIVLYVLKRGKIFMVKLVKQCYWYKQIDKLCMYDLIVNVCIKILC